MGYCKGKVTTLREQEHTGRGVCSFCARTAHCCIAELKRGLLLLLVWSVAELKCHRVPPPSENDVRLLMSPTLFSPTCTAGADTKAAKFFINCLAEEAHVVADTLVPRIRKVPQESKGGGGGPSTYIKYLTKQKAYTQIIGRLIGGRRKNRFVQEE